MPAMQTIPLYRVEGYLSPVFQQFEKIFRKRRKGGSCPALYAIIF